MQEKNDSNVLNFIDEGDGEFTLVFLHYFGGSSKSWKEVIKYLKLSFRCIAIDLPGFGDSSSHDNTISVSDNATDVINIIRKSGLKKYILIGHSMGGKIALYMAAKYPEGLQKLILIAPSPPTPEPMKDKDRADLIKAYGKQPYIEKLIKKITAKTLGEDIFNETLHDHLKANLIGWNSWLKEGSCEDISEMMHNIKLPLMILSGESDPNFSDTFLRKEFSRYFPGANFEMIAATGHLIPIETPLVTAKLIKDFINNPG